MSFFDKIKITNKKEEPSQSIKNQEDVAGKNKTEPQKVVENTQSSSEQERTNEKAKEKKEWPEPEGQLAIDVFETEDALVIQSTIAGVKAEDLDISIEDDMLTIKGERKKPDDNQQKNYFYQECYWGPFSRQVILPEEVDESQASAKLKDGILTLSMPKLKRKQRKKILVKEED